MAIHRRHAVPDREPRRQGSLLPERRPTARRRACPAGGRGRDRGDRAPARALEGRRAPRGVVGRGARHLLRRPRPRRHRGQLLRAAVLEAHPELPAARRPGGLRLGAAPPGEPRAEGSGRARPSALARRRARRAAVCVSGCVLARRQARVHGASPGAPSDVRRRRRRAHLLAGRREAGVPWGSRREDRPRRCRVHERRARFRRRDRSMAGSRTSSAPSWGSSTNPPATQARGSWWCEATPSGSRRSSSG